MTKKKKEPTAREFLDETRRSRIALEALAKAAASLATLKIRAQRSTAPKRRLDKRTRTA